MTKADIVQRVTKYPQNDQFILQVSLSKIPLCEIVRSVTAELDGRGRDYQLSQHAKLEKLACVINQ